MLDISKLNIDDDVEGQNEDFLPGDFTKNTGLYPMTVDMAYLMESTNGAIGVTLHLKEIGGNAQHREDFYVTSRTGSNTYVDKRTKKKRLLPGMDAMNQLALIAAGKKLPALTPEEKIVKVWNFDEKKELPTKVQALTELIGQEVLVALVKRRENKTKKVGDAYVPTPEERVFNEVNKFLYPDGHTVAEKIAEEAETTFRTKWEARYDSDYINDKYTEVAPANGVAAASAAAGAANAKPVSDIFDDDDDAPAETAPAPVADTQEPAVVVTPQAEVAPAVAAAPPPAVE